MKKSLFINLIIMLILQSCSSSIPTSPANDDNGKISISLDKNVLVNAVSFISIELTSSESQTIIKELSLKDITNNKIDFPSLKPGLWNIHIKLYDEKEELLYQGRNDVVVTKDGITPLNVLLNSINGKLIINIDWLSTFLGDIVAFYPFSGNANDVSGNGHDGKVEGPILVEDRFGNKNNAFYFDGIDDYIKITDSDKLTPSNQKLTIAAWVNNLGSKNKFILYKGSNLYNREYALGFHNKSLFSFQVNHNGSWDAGQIGVQGDSTIIDNQWYFVTGTWDGKLVKIYVNGELENSIETNATIGNYNSDLFLGTYGGRINEYSMKGIIDDLVILNRVLTPYEISLLYNSTK